MNGSKLKPLHLSYAEFISALVVKVLLGFVYGYIYLNYYNGDDTWRHFNASLTETKLLLENPAVFFRNEYTPTHSIEIADNWKQATLYYLNDLQYALFVKSFAIVNLITGGNYYLNSIVYNIIVFFGHYRLFVLLTHYYPDKRKYLFLSVFFFLPAVFWLSGFRIDGVVFFFFTLFIYHLAIRSSSGRRRMAYILAGYMGLIVCRIEVALYLLPAVIAYFISLRKKKSLGIYLSVYALATLLFLATSYLPGGGLPARVANIQHRFLALEGTRFQLMKLDHTPVSYVKTLPQAFANTFLKPFPWETNGFLQLMAGVEIIIFWLLVILVIFNMESDWRIRLQSRLILLFLFFSVSLYLAVGYTVPFPGAIIRYKALAELLLVSCMAILVRSKRPL